ncbi:MAG TPA: hypothetical protein PKA39_09310 [Ignavibacteria bacterium]|nr:hypothetical protein [Ignavibacteria bacterium]
MLPKAGFVTICNTPVLNILELSQIYVWIPDMPGQSFGLRHAELGKQV